MMVGVRRGGAGGLTLVEVLAVLVVMAIILGLAVGAFLAFGRGLAGEAAVQAAVSILRGARETARGEGMPAVVTFDAQERMAWATAREARQVWDLEMAPRSGAVAAPGRIGLGWRPSARGATVGQIDLLAAGMGFFVEFWVRPEREGAVGPILNAGDLEVGLERQMRLEVRLGGERLVSARPVPVDAWTHVAVLVDPDGAAVLLLGRREEARRLRVRFVPPSGAQVMLGGRGSFVGVVDEVIVGQMRRLTEVHFGAQAELTFPLEPQGTQRLEVVFDGAGRTERRQVIRIRTPEATREIEVHPGGMVERREVESN